VTKFVVDSARNCEGSQDAQRKWSSEECWSGKRMWRATEYWQRITVTRVDILDPIRQCYERQKRNVTVERWAQNMKEVLEKMFGIHLVESA
jgi:hypothetical protein